jgi:rare lipoprotein A
MVVTAAVFGSGVPAAVAESMVTSCYRQQHGLAAHRTLPFGTRLRVVNPRNGRSAVIVIRDRGPFIRGRHLDISCSLMRELGIPGVGRLLTERLS